MNDLFISRLRQLRKTSAKTQSQIAELIDVSHVNYAKYETNGKNPSLQSFIKLCLLFDSPAERFFNEKRGGKSLNQEQIAELEDLDDKKLMSIYYSLQAMYESKTKQD